MKNTAIHFPKISAIIFLMILCACAPKSNAQTTWNGSESSDWFDADNWSDGVPDASDDVTIPDMVPNNPEIGSAGAVAKSVDVNNNAYLSIGPAGTLNIDNSDLFGIVNRGTIDNNGTISIGNMTPVGNDGVRNRGVFNNNTGGHLNIDRCANRGIRNYSDGTFTNEATISIGVNISVGDSGILNEGIFNNNVGGVINIDQSVMRELFNDATATFNNEATINIGATTGGSDNGIRNDGTFNNNTGGEINIDRSTLREIINQNLGTFNNEATINIGSTIGGAEIGLRNDGNFNNNTGGQINIDRSTLQGLYITDGTFTNEAAITIGAAASIGATGILNEATFDNNTGGVIKIYKFSVAALMNSTTGNFTNNATTEISESTSSNGIGIDNEGTLTNTGGSIQITDIDSLGIINKQTGVLTNSANIKVIYWVNDTDLYNYGIVNNNSGGVLDLKGSNFLPIANWNTGTINNWGEIVGGNLTLILGSNYGTINNYSGATINLGSALYEGFFNNSGATINNEATSHKEPQRTPLTTEGAGTVNNLGGTAYFRGNQPIYGGNCYNSGTISAVNHSPSHAGITSSSFTNDVSGTINISNNSGGGREGIKTSSILTNYGEINIGGTGGWDIGIELLDGTFENLGGEIEINNAGIAIDLKGTSTLDNEASIIVNGTTTVLNGTGTFSNKTGGILTCAGDLTASVFESSGGTLAPGNSPGTAIFDGDEDFSNSILSIEIDGTGTAGIDYDQVVVNGTATLGGTLHLIEGYTPVNGDQVVILDATSLSGTFSSVTGATNWFVNYDAPSAGDITLSYGAPLPVELIQFDAREQDGLVLLDWRTASESNNMGFYIERSNDGRTWETLGFVAGNGTSQSVRQYSFLDERPLSGLNYYRLRQMDFDGQSENILLL